MKNILIVAITRLGDMLQASPTIVGLREENPDARIVIVIDKQFAAICRGIPGIDEVYVLDLTMVTRCIHRGGDGIAEAYRYVDKMIGDLRERKFDYVLNMSSSPYTALMLKMLDAPESRGWMADEEGYRVITDPWAMLFAAFVYHSNRDFNSLNLVDIFRCAAGVRKHPERLVFETDDEEKQFADDLLRGFADRGSGPIIGIQAGASQSKRQWPVERFARLTELLVTQLDAKVVFTGSPSERPILDGILSHYNHPNILPALGKTTFGQLAGLLERLDLLITGDTGPMHLAVAVETPVVALFLASALCFETGPYSHGNLVLQPQIDCNPCNPNFPCARPDCHDQISPELVVQLVDARLRTPLGQEQTIQLESDLVRRRQVGVYFTAFDEDGFLEFRSIGGESDRNGYSAPFYQAARAAYRAVWKEEFYGVSYRQLAPDPFEELTDGPGFFEGLRELVSLANHGKELLHRLLAAVQDSRSPASILKDLNSSIQNVDKTIEEIGLSYPVTGALVRIFLMEKENLRGDDVRELASETTELYTRLVRRSRRFGQLFRYHSGRRASLPIVADRPSEGAGGHLP